MRLVILAFVTAALAGCATSGVSEADQAAVRQEFSKDNYEKAMIDAGKGAELEAEKKKEATYMKGDASSQESERE